MKGSIPLLILTLTGTVQAQWSGTDDDPSPNKEAGHLFQVFSKDEWMKSNFAAENDIQWFRAAKYGMFVHFGLSTYKNAELSWGICQTRKAPDTGSGPYPEAEWTTWSKEFRLPDFDAKKMVEYAKESGMKYIVVIAKHHDGFHMWDTALSDFKITKTPFGRDFIKEAADACHEAGIKFGIYYSQRDWYHPDYAPTDWKSEKHQRYLDYQNKAVRELCTNYGKVDVFWFDAAWWGGMFTAEMWDAENLTRMIRQLQPGILINNRASVPGDFDTPEGRIGMFQNHRPWETCTTLCSTWSYSETPSRTPKQIIDVLVRTLCGDGNLLLSWGQKWSGEFDVKQVESLKGTGEWVSKNKEAIYGTRGGPWKPAKWGGSVYRDKTVYLHVFKVPDGNKLVLADLKPKVLKAAIHGGAEIPFTQKGEHLELTLPTDKQDPLCTVVELSVDSPITEIIPAKKQKSIFDADPEYGDLISEKATLRISSTCQYDDKSKHPNLFNGDLTGDDFAFHTDSEVNPYAIIDLGTKQSIRGILIHNREDNPTRKNGVMVSLSVNGNQWEEIWKQTNLDDVWEIPVTRFVAGANLLGKEARFVKIERRLSQPDALHLQTVKIYGK